MNLAAARQQFPNLRDYTDDEILSWAASSAGLQTGSPQYRQLEQSLLGYDRSLGEVAKDTAVGVGQGLLGLGQVGGMALGAVTPGMRAFDNPVANAFGRWQEGMNEFKSPGIRAQESGAQAATDIAQRESAARGDGFGGQVLAGAGAQAGQYLRNPGLLLQDAASTAPQMLAGGVAGRAAAGVAGRLGAAAPTASRVGVATGYGTAAGLQGGDVAGDTYERLIRAGASPEVATQLAAEAGMKAGGVSLGLTMLPGGGTIERSLVPGAGRMSGRFGRTRAGMAEAGTEGFDEAYGAYAGNEAVHGVDPTTNLATGVGPAFVQGAAVGGPMGFGLARPRARTETGEVDLSKSADPAPTPQGPGIPQHAGRPDLPFVGADFGPLPPADLFQGVRTDIPAYSRRGEVGPPVDPARRQVAPFVPPVEPRDPAEPANWDLVEPVPAAQPALTGRPNPRLGMNPGQSEIQVDSEGRARAATPDQIRAANIERQNLSAMGLTPDVAAAQARREGAMPPLQQAPEQAPVPAGPPTRGQILAMLQQANTELNRTAIRKDGQPAGGRANAPIRAILEAKDPLSVMRDQYADGQGARDELLDTWHRNLTGQTISDWKAASPPANSAGFTPEPQPQVDAQVQAVREGRKPAVVLGTEQAAKTDLKGLAQATIRDPETSASAVVAAQDPGMVTAARQRTKAVGLKQAMGEVTGVANPGLTTAATLPADATVVQQVDDQSGQVITEEVATPADAGNIRLTPGTTARSVPVEQAVQDRTAGEKPPKRPRLGKRTVDDLIEMANSVKDDATYDEVRFELYRRWADHGDEQAEREIGESGEAPLSSDEQTRFQQRLDAEREKRGRKAGQALGAKFRDSGAAPRRGVSLADAKSIVDLVTGKWSNAPKVNVAATMADLPEALRADADGQGATAPKGAYWRSQVWVIAANHTSPQDVVTTLLHEITGHAGLRGLLGDGFKPAMMQIYNGNPEIRRGADRMAAEEGLPVETAVEEVLADMAESGPIKPTVLQRVGNALRALMNRLGLTRFTKGVTDGEVAELLQSAREHIESGRPGGGQTLSGAAAFRRDDEPASLRAYGQAARNVASAARSTARGEEINSSLLSVMTLRQIEEQFGKRLPALKDWIGAIFQRSSKASSIAAEADRVALQWEQSVKDHAERRTLADVLLRASVAEISLDRTDANYLAALSEDQRAEHAELRRKLQTLSPDAQRTREQVRRILDQQWDNTRSALEKFVDAVATDPGVRAERLSEIRQLMGRSRGDYFPLSRFGDRVVIARGAAEDGRDVVSFHETAAGVEAEKRRLKDAGVKDSQIIVTLQTERDPRSRISTGVLADLQRMVDSSEADGSVKDSMHEALQQIYLRSLPEMSGAKRMIRRESVEGFSRDALRVFADAVTRGARYAANLEFSPEVTAAMEAAEVQTRSNDRRSASIVIGRKDGAEPAVRIVPVGTARLDAARALAADGYATESITTIPAAARERLAGAIQGATDEQLAKWVGEIERVAGQNESGLQDLRAAKALYNHMVKLQAGPEQGDSPLDKAVDVLGQAGYTWFLGFSPAFWAMNTLQNPMIGIPHLGAQHGVAAASGEWMKALSWFGSVRMGKLLGDRKTPFSIEWLRGEVGAGRVKGLSKNELDMLQVLEDKQVLDFTQAMDLSRIGQASSGKWNKFLRLAAAGAHHTEVMNRVSFALASYRLALRSDGSVTHEDAMRRAENDVAAVHFDYSFANKPELMRGRASRLIFMFQQYRQHMLYWWAKTIKDAVRNESPGDRSRAMKAALLMGTTNLVFAGTLGLPFIGAVGLLANLLGGDDDEPFDFERWIQEAATEATGSPQAGQILAKGIFTAVGMNIGQRIGQADLLPLANLGSARFERGADDKMRAYLFDMLGPLGSIALGAARSTEAFARGDAVAGMSHVTPKAMADLLKAYQLDNEGLKNSRGQVLAAAESFDGSDVLIQALGISPTRGANIRQDRGRILDVEKSLQERTGRLKNAFVESWSRGDQSGISQAMRDIQTFNEKVAIGKYANRDLAITGRELESSIRDRRQRQMLLALTGGTAETKRQLLLAMRMSGLVNPLTADGMQDRAGNLPGLPGVPGGVSP